MKAKLLCTLLFLAASTGCHAAVPRIADYYSDTRAARPPWFVNDNDSLQNDDSALGKPLCKDGLIQTPPPATDLHAFFAGRPVTRTGYRREGNHLPGGRSEDGNDRVIAQRESIRDAGYARLNFSSPATDIIPIRAAPNWFDGSGMLTSTCLACAPEHFVAGEVRRPNSARSPRSHAPRGNAYGKPK